MAYAWLDKGRIERERKDMLPIHRQLWSPFHADPSFGDVGADKVIISYCTSHLISLA